MGKEDVEIVVEDDERQCIGAHEARNHN